MDIKKHKAEKQGHTPRPENRKTGKDTEELTAFEKEFGSFLDETQFRIKGGCCRVNLTMEAFLPDE